MTPISPDQFQIMQARTSRAINPKAAAAKDDQAREKLAAGKEKELQDAIVQYCELNGLYVLRPRMDKKATIRKGHPDLSIWGRDCRSVLIECKAGYNKPDEDQWKCIGELRAAGAAVLVCWSLQDAIHFIRTHLNP